MDEMVRLLKQIVRSGKLTTEESTYWLWTLFLLKSEPWDDAVHRAILASLCRLVEVA